ncbi:MFS transporter [Cognatishimia sp. SS12]|uniref:MFS transporter n=1 Tax=Cognatishimia sp. SS12 TaxID=2979465 RepID=UPI00232F6FA6|nr:MFS transporter [Cognatishimia sp. SS12]MDC0738768.1 MFS transporter [Cognatishimia sp. SS12]
MLRPTSKIFILATIMVDAMGIGLIMPVTPELIREIEGSDIADAAIWGGLLATLFAGMLFLFGPVIGGLSDRYGRRPLLLSSLAVMAVSYLVMGLTHSMIVLILARLLGGIAAATQATASAYMADISTQDEKARNFGLIGAGFGVGFVLGPMLGGLLGEYGTRAPMFAAAFLATAIMLLGCVVLKESLPPEKRRAFLWRRANPLGALLSIAKMPGLSNLIYVFFLYQLSVMVYPVIWPYFTAQQFGWGPGLIGLSLGIFGVTFALVQGGLVQPAVNLFGARGAVVAGISMEVIVMTLMAFITAGSLALIATPLAALATVGLPALQGLMSQSVPDDAQGELQGVLSAVSSIGMILSPLLMTQTFAYFSSGEAPIFFPGAVFVLAASLMGGALLVLSRKPLPDNPLSS